MGETDKKTSLQSVKMSAKASTVGEHLEKKRRPEEKKKREESMGSRV